MMRRRFTIRIADTLPAYAEPRNRSRAPCSILTVQFGAPDAAHAYSDSPMMSGPMLPKFGFPMATAYTVLTRMKVKISSQPAAWQLK